MAAGIVAAAFLVRSRFTPPVPRTVVINEVLAANSRVLADDEGDFSDWVELYNPTGDAIPLGGYRLSDDPGETDKWVFPPVTLGPEEHLVVWASHKGRIFLGPAGTTRRLLVQFESAGLDDGDHAFIVVDGADRSPNRRGLNLVRLDHAGAYVESRSFGTHDSKSESEALAAYVEGLARGEIVALAVAGDAAAHLDAGARSALGSIGSRFIGDLETGDSWGMVAVVGQGRVAEAYSSSGSGAASDGTASSTELHAGFKLRRSGEAVALHAPDGRLIDSVVLGGQVLDVSFGRHPDGGPDWCSFARPTPRARNAAYCSKLTEAPQPSLASGSFDQPITVSIRSGAMTEVHYTLDGSEPRKGSPTYGTPLPIESTTVLRARGFRKGFVPGPVVTRTYLIKEKVALPVVSLVTDPRNLWDETRGIYADGKDPDEPNYQQRGRRWERPVEVEFLDAGGSPGFASKAGMRIFGRAVRVYPKKSFVLHFRDIYGQTALEYPVFPGRKRSVFRSLVLRNGGDDGRWDNPKIRDGVMQALWAEQGGLVSAKRPVFVFLNGAPWGIYDFREKIDTDYLALECGVEDADLMRGISPPVAGDRRAWDETLAFFETHGLGDDGNFARARALVDLDNFTDYWIFQIYSGNIDLEEANMIWFRPRATGGRWRWIMWDMDVAFGLVPQSPVTHDTLAWYTRDKAMPGLGFDDDDGSDTLWATLPLRRFLEAGLYRDRFIRRFADLLNTTLSPGRVISEIDSQAADIEPDVPRDLAIWKEKWEAPHALSYEGWKGHVAELRMFARRRPSVLRVLLMRKFGLGDSVVVTVEAPEEGKGSVRINTIMAGSLPWTGVYFQGMPITFEAVPEQGYVFEGWGEPSLPDTGTASTVLGANLRLRPRFSPLAR